ncbi:NFX1-type zinc finger-containing 1, partial [Brachionus plicatilis]
KGAELTKQIINKIKKIQYLNTYFDVSCINVTTSGQGIVYVMQLDNEKIKSINWETSKRLIFGSLICFSSDYFLNECLIGIVCERDEQDLRKKGWFNVKFDFEACEVISYPEFGKSYIMLETSAFFESYKHVLKALKTFKREGEDNFPFKENLVYCQNAMMPLPKYLKEASVDFTVLVDRKKKIQMNKNDPRNNPVKCYISNPASWPSAEQMRLDKSQYEAVKLALTNKLALIQGPPGTGKTFLGVKLVKFLLDNKHSWWNRPNERHKPILMICYTNHALDQFLEYCIDECKLTSGVVRVGGRSKSESLEPFLLKNLKQSLKSKRQIDRTIYYNIVNQYRKISTLKENLASVSRTLDLIFNCQAILTIQKLKNYINPMHLDQLLINHRRNDKDIDLNFYLIDWLGLLDFDEEDFVGQLENLELTEELHGQFVTGLNADQDQEEESKELIQNNEQPNLAEPDSEEEDDNFNKERILDDNFDDFTSTKVLNLDTKELLKKEELYDMIKTYRYQMGYSKEGKWKVKKGKKVIDADFEKLETTLEKIFAKTSNQYSNNDLSLIENCPNIWRLDYTQRHLLYFHWVNKYKNEQEEKIKQLNNQYNNEINQMQELRLQEDRSIMQDAYIIAMTTTGSSRYHSVLKDIGPRIIIVEEAAEVFEAHIVSALSKHCEHLILIGDHVQLRPNPAVYTLATQYQLDVSLFERLINNNTKRVMLNNQHRMRPEISVLMKHFYEETI